MPKKNKEWMGDVSRYKRLAMRTKLNLVVFFVLLTAAYSGRAQGEFVAGYGLFSSVEVDNTFYSPSVSKIVTLDEQYNSHSDALGPWVIGYKHAFGRNFAVGLLGVVASMRTNYFGEKDENGSVVEAKQRVLSTQYSTLVRMYYSWINVRNLNVYSSLAAGLSYESAKNSTESKYLDKFSPAYQANLLGIRVGSKLGAYLELGYGYAGVASVGLSLYL